jgi:hypothetical protein
VNLPPGKKLEYLLNKSINFLRTGHCKSTYLHLA